MPRIGLRSDRETLLAHQVTLLKSDIRMLRLALQAALPHVPLDLRPFPVKALEETHP